MVAYELLSRVEKDDSYINLLLPSFLAKGRVQDQDRGLIHQTGVCVVQIPAGVSWQNGEMVRL